MEDHLLPAPSHVYGPTWRRRREGGWHLPEKSLGWEIINWLYKWVRSPGGEYAGEGFLPTDEQARFLLWWYAVDDNGRFVYRSGVLRRMKGWGKDPLAAAMGLAELCGPVAFSHWDANGDPVGKPRHAAWVQFAAVSQEQTKNSFALFPVMISQEMRREYGLDVNKTVIYSSVGGRIEAVTSSPASMEGNRPTFVILNETQWWVESVQGHEMAGVIEGNVKKSPGGICRSLAICNAHIPGEESVAELAWEACQAVEAGLAVDIGLLYDALEAPADCPISEIPARPRDREDPDYDRQLEAHNNGIEKLREGLRVARGDSTWLDIDTIIESILDVRNPVTESRRKFLNQINASEDSWISPQEWDRCQQDVTLGAGERITLGFDGSRGNDYTALVACRVSDGAVFPIKVWVPDNYKDGKIPREDVDAVVQHTFARYEVVAMRADVREFEAYIDQWSTKYRKQLLVNASPGNVIAFDMRGQQKKFSLDCERFLDAVLEEELIHNGHKTLRTHVLNACLNPTNFDTVSIRKASKDSSKKIDAAVCAVLAWAARQDVLMSPKNRSRTAIALHAN